MARDNSPKERQLKHLRRKLKQRASYDRILIVSEGCKTEPNYFREIRQTYRLHTANVEVRCVFHHQRDRHFTVNVTGISPST